jgi:hypothetical protein
MAHEILVIVLGWAIPLILAWVVARIPRVRAWFARNQVAEAVALSGLLSILISATCLLIYDRYFATPDFYVKAIPSNIQHTEMSCNDGDSGFGGVYERQRCSGGGWSEIFRERRGPLGVMRPVRRRPAKCGGAADLHEGPPAVTRF